MMPSKLQFGQVKQWSSISGEQMPHFDSSTSRFDVANRPNRVKYLEETTFDLKEKELSFKYSSITQTASQRKHSS